MHSEPTGNLGGCREGILSRRELLKPMYFPVSTVEAPAARSACLTESSNGAHKQLSQSSLCYIVETLIKIFIHRKIPIISPKLE